MGEAGSGRGRVKKIRIAFSLQRRNPRLPFNYFESCPRGMGHQGAISVGRKVCYLRRTDQRRMETRISITEAVKTKDVEKEWDRESEVIIRNI